MRRTLSSLVFQEVLSVTVSMWLYVGRWKPNKLGDLSTAGTTACTVIFRQDHFYVANVGDSSAVLGELYVVLVMTVLGL